MVPWAHPSLCSKPHVDRISRLSAAHRKVCLYFTVGWYMFSKNCPYTPGDLDPNMVSWAHPSPQPKRLSIGSSVFAELMIVSDIETDRPRNVCSNRPHLMLCIAMRPNNNTYISILLSEGHDSIGRGSRSHAITVSDIAGQVKTVSSTDLNSVREGLVSTVLERKFQTSGAK